MLDEVKRMGMQIIALQGVVAALLAELAIMHDDPPAKLGQMTAGLLGVAEGVAKGAGVESNEMTAVVERICAMAEATLVRPPSKTG